MTVRDRIRHAFALDASGPATPNEIQRDVVERLVREVVRRRLTTPALLLLELCRPLTFLSAQAIHFFQPLVSTVTDARSLDAFAQFVEQRGSVDYIEQRLEALERTCAERERPRASGPDAGRTA